jgi:phage repressor protein C with HTH and peptisase S24 domain
MQDKNSPNLNLIITRLKSILKIKTDKQLCEAFGISQTVLANWKARGSWDWDLIITFCENKRISIDYLVSAETPNYSQIENSIHVVNEPAAAGYGSGDIYPDRSFSQDYYNIPEIKGRADYLIRVKGSSMEPRYLSGDVLACKKVSIQDFFQWNRSYVLDTTQGPLLKRVKKATKEGYILLVSDNKEFDPFEIELSEVRSLGLIVALIRVE